MGVQKHSERGINFEVYLRRFTNSGRTPGPLLIFLVKVPYLFFYGRKKVEDISLLPGAEKGFGCFTLLKDFILYPSL